MVLTDKETKIARATALRKIAIDQLNIIEICANKAKADIVNLTKFKMAFKNLKKMQKDFEKHHNAMVVAYAAEPDKLVLEAKILEDFTTRYLDIETIYSELVTEKELLQRKASNLSSTFFHNSTNISHENACLPKIDLIQFTGEIQNFPTFIEMFDALVHNSKILSNIEKFNYLLSKLSGPPLALIKNLPMISDNYLIAYNTIKNRYDNKRLRAVNCWKALESCAPVTKDNFYSLQKLLDTFTENLESLKMMSYDTDRWDFIITNMLLDRLDSNTRKAFEQSHASNDMPDYRKVKEFVLKKCNALETIELCTRSNDSPSKPNVNQKRNFEKPHNHYNTKSVYLPSTSRNSNALLVQQTEKKMEKPAENSENCYLCHGSHIIYHCATFLNKNPSERFQFIKNKKACINCLADQHTTAQCTSQKRCRHCKKNHHSLLHFPSNDENQTVSHNSNTGDNNNRVVNVGMLTKDDHEVLLSTVLLNVQDAFGNWQRARAIIDPGAQSCFIEKKFADFLSLPKYNCAITLQGLEKMCMPAKSGIHCNFSSVENSLKPFETDFIIIEKICDNLPNITFSLENFPYLKGLKLADPEFNKNNEIQMLLGAEIFPFILRDGRVIAGTNQPACINTVFGWIVMGKLPISKSPVLPNIRTFFTTYSTEAQLDNTLKLFWQSEEMPEYKAESTEDTHCENYFLETTRHNDDHSFTVSLPFKISAPDFGDTRSLAMRRFLSLEKRLLLDTNMYNTYGNVMKEYLDNGHMTQVSSPSLQNIHDYFYIAHHAVIRKDSTSTPLRVVFDASAHAYGKASLNQSLYTGPKLQRDLIAILLNFRLHRYVMLCDIRQMYRMIWVESAQRKYQRILWRFQPDDPILDYQLNVVVFGVSSSPFLAIRTLLHLASNYDDLPLASEIVYTQSFVDDISFGHNDLETVLSMRNQLITLLKRGKFELRKWASNERSLLEGLPESHVQNIDFSFDLENDSSLKILGLKWSPSKDTFYYPFTYTAAKCTKRLMLSELAKTFDPLGFLTPTTFFMKLLIQHLWTLGLGWDETPPHEVEKRWMDFKRDLTIFSSFFIPRQIDLCNYSSCQLVGFCDASTKGTCAVTYLRVVYENSSVKTFFLYARSKVAPLQTISLPRLELAAAVLLSKLITFILDTYQKQINIEDFYAFSDSTVALSWIKSSPHMWKTYVANRAAFIQERVPPTKWHHVSTKENPADCGSRGLFPSELTGFNLWWFGPDFLLKNPREWTSKYSFNSIANEAELEKRKITLTTKITLPNFLDNFLNNISSLSKIKRIIAYILRFINNIKGSNQKSRNAKNLPFNSLHNDELHYALLVLIKHVQNTNFSQEILCIKNKELLPKRLKRLNPILDAAGMLRVGGRLCHSELSFNQKHPLLLPSKSILTTLLIRETHISNMHAGIQTTCAILMQNFWILSVKNSVRSVICKCVPCWKTRPPTFQPPMGNLPEFRVNQARPFLNTGVDLAGPFTLKVGKLRNAKTSKAWICLFVCCATKALHIELLSDLSTECFLAGFRRLMGRRGICKNVYSDCGTNFLGANNYLNTIFSEVSESEGIKWHFNPPAAPHMGGLWEANIKSVKSHLKRVIGLQILTYEEMNTVLIQIEAVLNSRPLGPLSSDPNDLSALTPGHFLTSEPLTAIPEPDTSNLPFNRLSRWQLLTRMRNDFWRRWRDEYLHTLTQRAKWHLPDVPTPVVGSLVLIRHENTPPLEWVVGRITELIAGADHIPRVAVVKTTKGFLKRPLVKLCPFPLN